MNASRTALVIVDAQHDFLPGGALGVPGGDEILAPLVRLGEDRRDELGLIIASRDWHPADHSSFAEQGGIWPSHCVQGTPGAEIHPAVSAIADRTISKGENRNVEQYSAAQATTLPLMLEAEGFTHVLVAGLATDYCVKATVLDLVAQGFQVSVLTDCVRGVDVEPGDSARALAEMQDAGARLTTSTNWSAAITPTGV